MILFNSTRKLKNSDGLMVLFQLFSIFEIGYFLTRTVKRLVVSNPWDNWDDSDQLTMLRYATYHYVNNGFLRQTSLKSNFFGFVFPFLSIKLILAMLFPEKAPFAAFVWSPLRISDLPKTRLRGTEAIKKLANQYPERTVRGPSLQMLIMGITIMQSSKYHVQNVL